MNFLEYTFTAFSSPEIMEILVAFLDERGYSGFIETGDKLLAYLPEAMKDQAGLEDLLKSLSPGEEKIVYQVQSVPEINWNEAWEKGFQPIMIDKDVRIRASFHPEDVSFLHDILIDPKMSFGTGHHETTRLMIREMLRMDFNGKKILDMGCGTGILAILASRLGSDSIVAVDIDEWSVNNAKENMVANSCRHIQILRGDIDVVPVLKYNIILANINRNILLEYMDSFRSLLSQEGSLVLSGIMDQDLESIRLKAGKTGFRELSSSNEKAWQCLHFYKV